MSAQVREALAAAANTVAGVNVSPWFRQSTKPGSGYVRLDRTDYPNPFGGLCTWQVVVLLPQDIATAEKWLADNGRSLVDAVSEELVVRSLTPIQLQIDTGAVPAVAIEGQREEE